MRARGSFVGLAGWEICSSAPSPISCEAGSIRFSRTLQDLLDQQLVAVDADSWPWPRMCSRCFASRCSLRSGKIGHCEPAPKIIFISRTGWPPRAPNGYKRAGDRARNAPQQRSAWPAVTSPRSRRWSRSPMRFTNISLFGMTRCPDVSLFATAFEPNDCARLLFARRRPATLGRNT